MRQINLTQIQEALSQLSVQSKVKTDFKGIGTDTRVALNDYLFIALKGEAFDAHNFVDKAIEQGATAVLVHEMRPEYQSLLSRATFLVVPDTLVALQELGRWARRQSKAKIIGITGSNGKTTSKEFSAALLSAKFKTHFNKGSFNNHWGVPFTLLQIPQDAEVAIIEMGMNHAGEITQLVQIAEPDIVVCSMVGKAHIEHFGTIEKIAKAKEEIYEAASESTIRIYNLDNPHTRGMFDQANKKFLKAKKIVFSEFEGKADVYLKIEKMSLQSLKINGQILGQAGQAEVNVFGTQNLTNLMVAASMGVALGMNADEIWGAITNCKTSWGRNQLVDLRGGALMIFDAYNANPDSMKALLENVRVLQSVNRKIGIFGEMLEMGEASPALHLELAERVAKTGFDEVVFLARAPEQADAFEKGMIQLNYKGKLHILNSFSEDVAKEIGSRLSNNDLIVLKGSRGVKLERFVPFFEPLNFEEKT